MSESTELMERILDQSKIGFQRIADQNQLLKWAAESQFALQAVQKNPKLLECARHSIQNAIINVAAVGLTLNPAHGYAYLVPEYNTSTKQSECVLRVSFKGLIKLANDAGVARWVKADVVKENDQFEFNGAWELPTHKMEPFSDRGKSVGVYCTIRTNEGDYLTETAPWSEVLKAKNAAKTKNVWEEWEDEMAKKFIIKRASKQWPQGNLGHFHEAVAVVNKYEGSEELESLDKIANDILEILHGENQDDYYRAEQLHEVYHPLDEETKGSLFTAITKGGFFKIAEKNEIKRLNFHWWKLNNPEEAERLEAEEAAG